MLVLFLFLYANQTSSFCIDTKAELDAITKLIAYRYANQLSEASVFDLKMSILQYIRNINMDRDKKEAEQWKDIKPIRLVDSDVDEKYQKYQTILKEQKREDMILSLDSFFFGIIEEIGLPNIPYYGTTEVFDYKQDCAKLFNPDPEDTSLTTRDGSLVKADFIKRANCATFIDQLELKSIDKVIELTNENKSNIDYEEYEDLVNFQSLLYEKYDIACNQDPAFTIGTRYCWNPISMQCEKVTTVIRNPKNPNPVRFTKDNELKVLCAKRSIIRETAPNSCNFVDGDPNTTASYQTGSNSSSMQNYPKSGSDSGSYSSNESDESNGSKLRGSVSAAMGNDNDDRPISIGFYGPLTNIPMDRYVPLTGFGPILNSIGSGVYDGLFKGPGATFLYYNGNKQWLKNNEPYFQAWQQNILNQNAYMNQLPNAWQYYWQNAGSYLNNYNNPYSWQYNYFGNPSAPYNPTTSILNPGKL